ncbi:uncharacterized protein LOC134266846 [Saccostrea cucullata]|uniref:uncharacterized protein LOC134266846 n=1 Tax=Saccostrea cuccullata TaxID=36930 RepID=UPI002ED037C6
MEPIFRKLPSGIPTLSDSSAARAVKEERREKNRAKCKTVVKVKAEALQAVQRKGGDVTNVTHLLGQYTIQFGQFRGMTFKWLLENAPGWVAFIVADLETSGESKSSDDRWLNKMALKKYVNIFDEGKHLVKRKKEEKERAKSSISKPVLKMPETEEQMKDDDSDLVACLEDMEAKSREAQRLKPTPNLSSASRKEVSVPVVSSKSTCSGTSLNVAVTSSLSRVVSSSSGATSSLSRVVSSSSGATSSLSRVVSSSSGSSSSMSMVSSSSSTVPNSSSLSAAKERNLLTTPSHQQQPSTSAGTELDHVDLLVGWKKTLPEIDHHWISETFFHAGKRGAEFDFSRVTKLWYDPPQPSLSRGVLNKPDRYFGHRLFLWMPRHLFHVQFHCPHSDCSGILTNSGVHQKTRRVLDVDSYYNMAAENLVCSKCGKKVISWSEGVLDQLDNATRSTFPCILTLKNTCDLKVVRLMRQRGLGNSSSAVRKQVREQHGESYLIKLQMYLSNCREFKASVDRGFFVPTQFSEPPIPAEIPGYSWFMKVYQLDVLQRVDYIKAHLTSQFGNILKMDSTKKITNKLAGKGRKTAMWATNIGNEHGQVLMSVLTVGEGLSLKPMIDGLVARYRNGEVSPPKALYVDRDCCGTSSVRKYFGAWPFLHIRYQYYTLKN